MEDQLLLFSLSVILSGFQLWSRYLVKYRRVGTNVGGAVYVFLWCEMNAPADVKISVCLSKLVFTTSMWVCVWKWFVTTQQERIEHWECRCLFSIFFSSHGSSFYIFLYISYQPLVQNGFFFFLGEDMREGIFGIFIPTVEVPLGQKAIC